MTCLNYRGFNGIRMDSECYSLYPEEREVILADSSDVDILEV